LMRCSRQIGTVCRSLFRRLSRRRIHNWARW
jgi:hypothetical protein